MRSIINISILLCCLFFGIGVLSCSVHSTNTNETTVTQKVADAEETAPAGQEESAPDPFAYTPPSRHSDRAMLKVAVESYIAAQESGDISKMSFAPQARFMENMSVTTKSNGLWNTALPIAFHRSIYDVARCKTFTEIIVTEGGHPYVIGTRLTVDNGKITAIDSLVTDEDDWLFNAENYLKYSKAEDWPVLPLDDRISRQDLIDAANQYFDFVFMDKGIRPPWGSPSARLEGGMYTNPNNEDKDTARVPAPIGELFINNRTFVVDEEMGAVNVFCRFGDYADGMPDSHTFMLVNGRFRWIHTLSVNLTSEPVDVPEFKPKPDYQCDREMLKAAVESYIAAQESGDISKMSLASDAKFRENMSEITKDKGLWNTALPIAFHRSIYDVVRCKTFSEVIVTEGGHPYVIGTRLTVDKGKIVEIESLVTDEGDWFFDADVYLKYSKAEDWPVLKLDERVSRQELVDAGNQYFDFIFMDQWIKPPWGCPCARLEGGAYTNTKNEYKDTCQVPAPLGELPITDRTFVVDEEMGTVNVFCRFGGGMPDSHTFRLVNGKYRWVHTLSVNLGSQSLPAPDDFPEFFGDN